MRALMQLETDAVTQAMRESIHERFTRSFGALRQPASRFEDLAGRRIHIVAVHTCTDARIGCIQRFAAKAQKMAEDLQAKG